LERPVKGDVVVISFPFSDLSSSKRRPALVVASLKGNDSILCQITSSRILDSYTIPLNENDFSKGSLKRSSSLRPNKLFTADNSIIIYRAGSLKKKKSLQVEEKICSILRDGG